MNVKTHLMNKLFTTIVNYFLIFVGFSVTSWIIWTRFIRERLIRYIPDFFLTEYRFWILFYICLIYLYVIKSLIKPKEINPHISNIIDILFKPLIAFDHSIKYNSFIKPYYYRMVSYIVKKYQYPKQWKLILLVFVVQVLPRIILVCVLLVDTFYFYKLKLFYKVILLGIFPLIFRYIKYSLRDIYDHWIIILEQQYQSVLVFQKDFRFDKTNSHNKDAIYHQQKKSIREYIDIKFENMLDCDVEYEYDSGPYIHEHIFHEYSFRKYNNNKFSMSREDFNILEKLYFDIFPSILNLKAFNMSLLDLACKNGFIKWSRVIICSLYFICWSFILFISYVFYPVDFVMAKTFLLLFMKNLCSIQDPFSLCPI